MSAPAPAAAAVAAGSPEKSSPAAAAASSSSSGAPLSPTPAALPSLGVEFPADHPIARRQSQLKAQADAKVLAAKHAELVLLNGGVSTTPLPSPVKEAVQANLLEAFSTPLSMPNSPAEQARRMSINPNSRRNSILAIPPIQEIPFQFDHTPLPGSDAQVDLAEIEKEIEEIDTIG